MHICILNICNGGGDRLKKELRNAMYMCQLPTMNAVVKYYKHTPIKKFFKENLNQFDLMQEE